MPYAGGWAGGGGSPAAGGFASALGSAMGPGMAAFRPAAPPWFATQWQGFQAPAPNTPWTNLAQTPAQIMTYAVPGSFMETVNLDPISNLADGSTSVFQVMQAHAPDAAGAYLEVAFLGSSNALRAQYIDGLMQRGAIVHLCAAFCQADTTTQRPVIHVSQVRLRQPQDLTEPWVTPNAALSAMQAAMGIQAPTPKGKAPPPPPIPAYQALAAGAGLAAGGGASAASAQSASAQAGPPDTKTAKTAVSEKKHKRKLLKLLKKAKNGSSTGKVQQTLLRRVKRHVSPKDDDADSTSSSSSVFVMLPTCRGASLAVIIS